ncbi:MAG: hypothetical protein U5L08_01130 [Xanthomonadales bacterium]|nr:hypothetical protein [Xanthomonadales bacterium]
MGHHQLWALIAVTGLERFEGVLEARKGVAAGSILAALGEQLAESAVEHHGVLGAQGQAGGNDSVEHHAANALGIVAQVDLRHARAVGAADQVERFESIGLAQGLEVCCAFGGGVVAHVGVPLVQAIAQLPVEFLPVGFEP